MQPQKVVQDVVQNPQELISERTSEYKREKYYESFLSLSFLNYVVVD